MFSMPETYPAKKKVPSWQVGGTSWCLGTQSGAGSNPNLNQGQETSVASPIHWGWWNTTSEGWFEVHLKMNSPEGLGAKPAHNEHSINSIKGYNRVTVISAAFEQTGKQESESQPSRRFCLETSILFYELRKGLKVFFIAMGLAAVTRVHLRNLYIPAC